MPARIELGVNRADTLQILGPTNDNTGLSIEGVSGIAMLLDDAFETFLTSSTTTTAAQLFVPDVTGWTGTSNDNLEVWLLDGTIHSAVVTAVDTDTKGLTISPVLPGVGAAGGTRVARRLGAELSLVEFGTVKAPLDQSGEWGYRVVKPIDHLQIFIGMPVHVHYRLDGGAGVEYEDQMPAIIVA